MLDPTFTHRILSAYQTAGAANNSSTDIHQLDAGHSSCISQPSQSSLLPCPSPSSRHLALIEIGHRRSPGDSPRAMGERRCTHDVGSVVCCTPSVMLSTGSFPGSAGSAPSLADASTLRCSDCLSSSSSSFC